MGEANYFGCIQFPTADAAHAAKAPIAEFLRMGTVAYDDWQEARHAIGQSARKRFQALVKRHREVFKALGLMNHYDECRQGEGGEDTFLGCLAGQMSFPDNPTVLVKGNVVIFFGVTWHMADWTRLVEGIRKRFGGIKAAWVSNERVVGSAQTVKVALIRKIGELPNRKARRVRMAPEPLPSIAGAAA